ncbi:MAG: hypothetical protein ACKOFP_02410 [Actinomycetota bacterium]
MIRPADLHGAQARALAARALEADQVGSDPLALVTALRRAHPEIDPDLVSAVVTEARLRERARERLAPWAEAP